MKENEVKESEMPKKTPKKKRKSMAAVRENETKIVEDEVVDTKQVASTVEPTPVVVSILFQL